MGTNFRPYIKELKTLVDKNNNNKNSLVHKCIKIFIKKNTQKEVKLGVKKTKVKLEKLLVEIIINAITKEININGSKSRRKDEKLI